jgi:hypothetical protein
VALGTELLPCDEQPSKPWTMCRHFYVARVSGQWFEAV